MGVTGLLQTVVILSLRRLIGCLESTRVYLRFLGVFESECLYVCVCLRIVKEGRKRERERDKKKERDREICVQFLLLETGNGT